MISLDGLLFPEQVNRRSSGSGGKSRCREGLGGGDREGTVIKIYERRINTRNNKNSIKTSVITIKKSLISKDQKFYID